MRWALLILLLGCADLPGEAHDQGVPDRGVPDGPGDRALDAAPDDSEPALDMALAPDASLVTDVGLPTDLSVPIDGPAPNPDAGWGDCVANGQPGACLHTDDCAARPVPGFCPGPAEIQCCVEGEPAACDPNAQPNPRAAEMDHDPLCPAGMVRLDDETCIDRYEAHLVDAAGEPWSPFQNPGDAELIARSVADVIPQGYIDGEQSSRACQNAGKRLCTNSEWLAGCQGPEGFTYPYGDARQPGRCNDARDRHPAVELFPDDPNPFARIQDPCINQLPDSLARTGAHPECQGDLGTLDMMGNLHEWIADPTGTFLGGFYVDTVRNGPGCLYRTTAHNTLHWDYSTGFRCCADAN